MGVCSRTSNNYYGDNFTKRFILKDISLYICSSKDGTRIFASSYTSNRQKWAQRLMYANNCQKLFFIGNSYLKLIGHITHWISIHTNEFAAKKKCKIYAQKHWHCFIYEPKQKKIDKQVLV